MLAHLLRPLEFSLPVPVSFYLHARPRPCRSTTQQHQSTRSRRSFTNSLLLSPRGTISPSVCNRIGSSRPFLGRFAVYGFYVPNPLACSSGLSLPVVIVYTFQANQNVAASLVTPVSLLLQVDACSCWASRRPLSSADFVDAHSQSIISLIRVQVRQICCGWKM